MTTLDSSKLDLKTTFLPYLNERDGLGRLMLTVF